MTKAELIEMIAKDAKVTKAAAGKAVDSFIDGVKKATVDLYRSSTAYKSSIWSSATLANGNHTLKIVVLGTKRSTAKGYDVSFDYFVIR